MEEKNIETKPPSLKRNISGLFLLHSVGFILTFAAIPYLTRVLGVAGWGKLILIQISLNYLCWFSNWGYYLGGTKSIAATRVVSTKTNKIFSVIWSSQLLITIVVLLIFVFLITTVSFFQKDYILYLSGLLVVIGNVLLPFWYLNGLEKIVESSLIQIFVKFLTLPLYFLFINNPNDIAKYFFINGGVAILVGVLMLSWMRFKLRVIFVLPSLQEVANTTKENFSLFLSTVLASMSTTIIPYALGVFSGDKALGLFNIADRMRGSAVQILHPISHALFPRMGYLIANNEKESAKRLLFRSGTILMLLSSLLSIILFIFSRDIVLLVAGEEFVGAIPLLQILAISPIITTISSFLIYQIIIPEGLDSTYLSTVTAVVLLSLLFVMPVLIFYGLHGATALVVFVEIVGLILLVKLGYKKLQIKHKNTWI